MEQQKIVFGMLDQLRSANERVREERSNRMADTQLLTTGIAYLDETLEGIHKKDLILIGAKSGIGKTELATQLALVNARLGKRVVYFALEAEEFEIERRIKYRMIADAYFGFVKNTLGPINLNYRQWFYGKFDSLLGSYEPEIENMFASQYESLKIFYKQRGDYTIDDFEKQFLAIKANADLILVDHLHYFDFYDDNENRAMKRIVKTCRDLALYGGVPVVLVAHVRKSDRRHSPLVPGLEDFHGTSDIGKIGTKSIMIAPANSIVSQDKTVWPTFMQTSKSRVDNSVSRYVGVLKFDAKKNCYLNEYALGSINLDNEFVGLGKHDTFPWWAKSAKAWEQKA